MRNITATALILSIIFSFNNRCTAQAYRVKTLSGSFGAEVLFPEWEFAAITKTGGGITLKAEYVFAEHASVTANTGYYFMAAKNTLNIINQDISAIPIKLGTRYYFGTFYGAGEAGGIFFTGNNSRAGFSYSIGLGDKFKLGRNVFDIGLRHEAWHIADISSRGVIGLRVAYEFELTEKQNSRMPEL